ncbi:MAG: hypothetical protein AB7T17_04575 [Geobacter sp.]|jgi:hypothetical protein|uniref:hypothetical protein n=1 Tax=Trichlorobacter sp. TaxID=2911007 RepID=UPI002A36BA16|nr:hypothetical protein [Trichlorobacter sp.]MDY0383699.1 hypothetical protein [Trichlorobacter sp.]
MKMRLMLTAVLLSLSLTTLAEAASFDLGARFGRTVEEDGGTAEVAARYFPIPLVSLGATLGYTRIEYDKDWYYKESDTMALGGYLNGHLPLPFVKPYAGIGGIYYANNDTDSANPADQGDERSRTMTIQGGVDISLPLPFLSVNIEARHLVSDDQTMILGGVWFRF